MNFFGKSEAVDKATAAVLELEVQKKRLEMERDSIKLELDNQKRREAMKLEEEAHKHKLKLLEEKAVFDREKKIWEKEKDELVANNKREFDLKMNEVLTLTKLDSQQKIKQAELDKDREVNALKASYTEEVAKVRSQLAEDYYSKLTAAFQDIQMNGDKNSKFVQELALRVFDKMPTQRTSTDVSVNMPALEHKDV